MNRQEIKERKTEESVPAGDRKQPAALNGMLEDPGVAYGAYNKQPAAMFSLQHFPGQGEYTVDDYLALPEGTRAELIDGFLYAMAAPTPLHQLIATLMGHQLMAFVQEHNCPCVPISSPVDVQLHKDDKTMLQPDVMILCRPEGLLSNKRIYGAPDFIAEILSPATRINDMTVKLFHYIKAGVREYWLVDPEKETVTVYDLEHEIAMQMYTFHDSVPVHIWKGNFSVDFEAIREYLRKLR